MARPQRIEYEGAVYQVTARGNERRAVFLDDRDRERFLRVLGESVEWFGTRLYLFCLMDNHVHLVVEIHRISEHNKSLKQGLTPKGEFCNRPEQQDDRLRNHRHQRREHRRLQPLRQ